jgi:hypothetical protein
MSTSISIQTNVSCREFTQRVFFTATRCVIEERKVIYKAANVKTPISTLNVYLNSTSVTSLNNATDTTQQKTLPVKFLVTANSEGSAYEL